MKVKQKNLYACMLLIFTVSVLNGNRLTKHTHTKYCIVPTAICVGKKNTHAIHFM